MFKVFFFLTQNTEGKILQFETPAGRQWVSREHISAFQVAAPRFNERTGTTAENSEYGPSPGGLVFLPPTHDPPDSTAPAPAGRDSPASLSPHSQLSSPGSQSSPARWSFSLPRTQKTVAVGQYLGSSYSNVLKTSHGPSEVAASARELPPSSYSPSARSLL